MQTERGIIVPCYNEAKRLNTRAFSGFLRTHSSYHICFVNDGSSDETLSVLQRICEENPDQASVLSNQENHGKGESVRLGMLKLMSDQPLKTIGFLDADLSTSLEEFTNLNNQLIDQSLIAVFGSRIKRMGAYIERSSRRHIIGRLFATMIGRTIKLPFYDTQCGAKVFEVSALHSVLSKPFITKWLFDVELILRLQSEIGKEAMIETVREYPLTSWVEVAGSKISISDTYRIPLDLLRIKRHYQSN
ncbi:MAG: glycosyltransferase [Bacteroidetes bacterium]|jgi:glycosyltransferase involved in cell wall biosynthesis|nr:glycosyltransferase [Bacteroidota bacterium]